jgi:NADPH:quinone reductase
MRAIVIPVTGAPEVLTPREIPAPEPGPGQVAIDVAYAGVNYAEVMLRRGDFAAGPLPIIPGYEVSGHIRALGAGVSGLRVGQPVAALTTIGGYAEVALAQEKLVFPLDIVAGGLDLATAAAFPTIVPTAYALLGEVGRLRPGETVLVQAAAGGVGTIAGQLARYLGASRVIGVVGSAEKVAYAERFGYDVVLTRDAFGAAARELTGGAGVDLVLDSIGGGVFEASLEALAPLGRVVVFGNASASPPVSLSSLALFSTNRSVLGFSIGQLSAVAPERVQALSQAALPLVANGTLRIDVTDVQPLEAAAAVHTRLEQGATMGKLLLKVTS